MTAIATQKTTTPPARLMEATAAAQLKTERPAVPSITFARSTISPPLRSAPTMPSAKMKNAAAASARCVCCSCGACAHVIRFPYLNFCCFTLRIRNTVPPAIASMIAMSINGRATASAMIRTITVAATGTAVIVAAPRGISSFAHTACVAIQNTQHPQPVEVALAVPVEAVLVVLA